VIARWLIEVRADPMSDPRRVRPPLLCHERLQSLRRPGRIEGDQGVSRPARWFDGSTVPSFVEIVTRPSHHGLRSPGTPGSVRAQCRHSEGTEKMAGVRPFTAVARVSIRSVVG
jgi:hypothetical protein